ncbi:hypothetical protein MJ579_16945 [Klebsiella pneumoniae]|nr:hypothetical protein MJ579_16945 [Klebsiella pneumoniae]
MNGKTLYLRTLTLRDGMHAIRHQYSLAQVQRIASARWIRPGSTPSKWPMAIACRDQLQLWLWRPQRHRLVEAASADVVSQAKSPAAAAGHRHLHDLKAAYQAGARVVRVATHCGEADVAAQHIALPASWGWTPSVF